MDVVIGLFLIALGAFHVWARNGMTEYYNVRSPWLLSVFPFLRYTPRATVFVGVGLIAGGILLILQSSAISVACDGSPKTGPLSPPR